MNLWLRRLLYLIVFIIWLAVMSFPLIAFTLASRGQLQVGGEQRHIRLFLLQETAAQGVGIEWTRSRWGETSCTQTNLGYLMWQGEGESSSFCQCYDPQTQAALPVSTCGGS